MDKTAGIVIIGDEILSGKFPDENAPFLIGELRELGVALRRIAVVPDIVPVIAETVRAMSEGFDMVFTSGGVGPTHDDVTMEAVAAGFGTDVHQHEDLVGILRGHYGDKISDGHLRLAEVPRGASLVSGNDPGWPVVCYQNVYILPGVPSLFARKFRSIRERFRGAPFATGRVYTGGDEAALAPTLNAVVADHPDVKFGSYPRFKETEYKILITVESKNASEVVAACDDLANRLGDLLVKVEPPVS